MRESDVSFGDRIRIGLPNVSEFVSFGQKRNSHQSSDSIRSYVTGTDRLLEISNDRSKHSVKVSPGRLDG